MKTYAIPAVQKRKHGHISGDGNMSSKRGKFGPTSKGHPQNVQRRFGVVDHQHDIHLTKYCTRDIHAHTHTTRPVRSSLMRVYELFSVGTVRKDRFNIAISLCASTDNFTA